MKETKRISKLFNDLYNGGPWIDINLIDTLKPLSAPQAFKKIDASWNSIWEIVNHIISWRKNVLRRVLGEIINTPSHNYFTPVKDNSQKAWETTIKELETSQLDWLRFLSEPGEKDFEKIYPNNNLTYYEHIQGILQHDAYHLGQIVLLAKKL